MDNFLWKSKKNTVTLTSKPFGDEEEFENLIMKQNLIGDDIVILTNQIRGGNKHGIPDVIGIDGGGNVCIIEMKNVPATSKDISQVLDYAMWAETNPDSIAKLVNDSNQLDDINIDYNDYDVRIIFVAPEIDESLIKQSGKINFPIDLIEINRWVWEKNEFFLVKRREQRESKKIRPVHGQRNYDEEFMLDVQKKNPESVKRYMSTAKNLEKISEKNNWGLDMKFNRGYCTLKYGFNNVCGLDWIGTKSFVVFVKLPWKKAASIEPKGVQIWRKSKNSTYYYLENRPIDEFIPLFKKAFELLVKKKG